jgi:hypothetical protein
MQSPLVFLRFEAVQVSVYACTLISRAVFLAACALAQMQQICACIMLLLLLLLAPPWPWACVQCDD